MGYLLDCSFIQNYVLIAKLLLIKTLICGQEKPLLEICELFKVQKGALHGLQESAGKFAGMVAAFCERLGWSDMGGLVQNFQKRVSFA